MKLNTTGYGGQNISKGVTVKTNDPQQATFELTLRGNVERFASVEPQRVQLAMRADQDLQREVKITPSEKYPFKIIHSFADKGKDISFTVTEKDGTYLVAVKSLQKTPGRYNDVIRLKTDSPVMEEIRVPVYINVIQ